jgi:hypothetical protein
MEVGHMPAPTTFRRSRLDRRGIIMAALVAVLAVIAWPSTGAANHWSSVTRAEGNPGCPNGLTEGKTETNGTGDYQINQNGLVATVTVGANSTVSFTSNQAIDVAIVKGGPPSHVYTYDPETFSDDGLSAPEKEPGQRYGVSHVTLCWDAGNPPPPDGPGPTSNPEQPNTSSTPTTTSTPQQGTANTTAAPGTAPVQATAPSRAGTRASVNARLRGPSRCVRAVYRVRVIGRGVRRVTFSVNGQRVRTVAGRSGARTYVLRLNALEYSRIQRVSARVEFVAAAQRAARTYRLRVRRCAGQGAAPRFTG